MFWVLIETVLLITHNICFGIGAVSSGSTLFASILNSSVMLGNYLQQPTSADDIFRCIFFLGTLRVRLLHLMVVVTLTFNFVLVVCMVKAQKF